MHRFRLLFPLGLLALAACNAMTPRPLRVEDRVADISPAEARIAGRTNVPVRWGGRIVETRPMGDRTCFAIVGSALSAGARPRHMTDQGFGRFIACAPGFYDPVLYLKNRELTIVGTITGYERAQVGEYAYLMPRVSASSVYLWPHAPSMDPRYPYQKRPWPWTGWEWPDTRY